MPELDKENIHNCLSQISFGDLKVKLTHKKKFADKKGVEFFFDKKEKKATSDSPFAKVAGQAKNTALARQLYISGKNALMGKFFTAMADLAFDGITDVCFTLVTFGFNKYVSLAIDMAKTSKAILTGLANNPPTMGQVMPFSYKQKKAVGKLFGSRTTELKYNVTHGRFIVTCNDDGDGAILIQANFDKGIRPMTTFTYCTLIIPIKVNGRKITVFKQDAVFDSVTVKHNNYGKWRITQKGSDTILEIVGLHEFNGKKVFVSIWDNDAINQQADIRNQKYAKARKQELDLEVNGRVFLGVVRTKTGKIGEKYVPGLVLTGATLHDVGWSLDMWPEVVYQYPDPNDPEKIIARKWQGGMIDDVDDEPGKWKQTDWIKGGSTFTC